MITSDGIDIKKAKLLFDGELVGIFTNLELSVEKPKETITTIGGEVKHRSGSDRKTWSAEGLIPVGNVGTVKDLCEKGGTFNIECEIADSAGVTETLTLTGAEISAYRMSISDNSVFNLSGIYDNLVS